MKTAIVLCALCFVSYTQLVRGDEEQQCLEKAGVTLADIPALIHDNSEEGMHKRGCIEACVMQKIGLMNGNTIDAEKLNEYIDKIISDGDRKETVRQNVQQCVTEAANDDECLVANSFAKCSMENLKLGMQQMFARAG